MATRSPLKDKTLGDLLAPISDRSNDVAELTTTLTNYWAYDLYARKPGPALLDNGVLSPTDLDLSCFLAALVDRRAVINLPTYRNRRPTTKKSTEHVISKDNRHGHIVGLRSNKDVFSFGVLVKDMNVMTSADDVQDVGAFRNFMIVDIDGTWHSGWKTIEFVPTAKENDWINDKKLWTGNKIVFKNFVHPNRWPSFYGKYYLATKVLIARMEEEARALRAWIKERRVDEPKKDYVKPEVTEIGPAEKVVVTAFEAIVDVQPGLHGKFGKPRSMNNATQRLKQITDALPALRFATRATELAFHQHGPDPRPAWVGGVWEDWKPKGGRTVWQRLVLHPSNVAIRYRTRDKTETVAANP
jgi:hypothetical protein